MGKIETRPAQFSRTSVFSRHQSLALIERNNTYAQTLPPRPILRHERPLSGREPRRRVCFFLDTIDRRFVGKQSNKFVPSIILFCFPARAGPQLSRSPSFYSPCCWLCRVCHSDHSSSRKSPDQTPCLSVPILLRGSLVLIFFRFGSNHFILLPKVNVCPTTRHPSNRQ